MVVAGDGEAGRLEASPASAAMSEQTARWYEEFTRGQLRAFLHADGCWYLVAAPVSDAEDGRATRA